MMNKLCVGQVKQSKFVEVNVLEFAEAVFFGEQIP